MSQRYDHGHPVDESKQCQGLTVSRRRCLNQALIGRKTCFIHSTQPNLDLERTVRKRRAASDRASSLYTERPPKKKAQVIKLVPKK